MALPGPGSGDPAAEVADLRAAVAALAVPSPLLDGWSSPAAAEYAAAVVRLARGVHRLAADLDRAAAALPGP